MLHALGLREVRKIDRVADPATVRLEVMEVNTYDQLSNFVISKADS